MKHLQHANLEEWKAASDEQHIQALFQRPDFINPRWIRYLERDRPHVMARYLQLWQAQGGYISSIAKRRLRNK